MTQRRAKRTYSEEQKKQLVELFNHGKPRSEIVREYDLTASAFDKWVKRINATGSSPDKDNRTPEELELLKLRKENQQLRMENDVLKQAVLIYARKVL
jgi:transposase